MGLINEYVDNRLALNINGSVVVSGTDGSGKTTMIKGLINKYNYTKYTYRAYIGDPAPYETYHLYKVFDRSPLIELYVYTDLSRDKTNLEKLLELEYLRDNLKYLDNPMFVIYLHSIWDQGDQPKWVYKYKDRIKNRYIDIIDMLIKLNRHVVVCSKNKVRVYN